MRNSFYKAFNGDIVWNMELRSTLNTDIFETRNDLFTEYLILSGSAKRLPLPIFREIGLDEELAFYLNLDLLTYLPFDKLGSEFAKKKLEGELSSVKAKRILKLIEEKYPDTESEVKDKVKLFFECYESDVLPLDVMSLAIVSLRLFHRYVTIMNFGGPLAMMTVQNLIDKALKQLKKDIIEGELCEIDVNAYLPAFDFEAHTLTDEMSDYITLSLQKLQ